MGYNLSMPPRDQKPEETMTSPVEQLILDGLKEIKDVQKEANGHISNLRVSTEAVKTEIEHLKDSNKSVKISISRLFEAYDEVRVEQAELRAADDTVKLRVDNLQKRISDQPPRGDDTGQIDSGEFEIKLARAEAKKREDMIRTIKIATPISVPIIALIVWLLTRGEVNIF